VELNGDLDRFSPHLSHLYWKKHKNVSISARDDEHELRGAGPDTCKAGTGARHHEMNFHQTWQTNSKNTYHRSASLSACFCSQRLIAMKHESLSRKEEHVLEEQLNTVCVQRQIETFLQRAGNLSPSRRALLQLKRLSRSPAHGYRRNTP